jgi:tRNA (guanine-N7-)-methyltransferase
MNRRSTGNSNPTELAAGDVEYEMGIPIPGVILAKEQWVQTALKRLPEQGPIEIVSLFGRSAPLCVDLGCGNGRFSLSSAVRRPDWNHLAVDILPAVIRYGTRRGNQRGLSNLRFAVCDAWRLLDVYLPANSVDEIHIYHPQPYADPAQSSKRMLTPEFLVLMHSRLAEGGKIVLQSDRREYWTYIQKVMQAIFQWNDQEGPWPEDPHGRSRREVLSIDQALPIFRGWGEKRSDLTELDVQRIAAELPQPQFRLATRPTHRVRRGRRR